jgi:hypothetical protein
VPQPEARWNAARSLYGAGGEAATTLMDPNHAVSAAHNLLPMSRSLKVIRFLNQVLLR